MTVAIHYTSINLPGAVKEVFGLQVAVSNWIKAYFRYGQQEKFNFLIGDNKDLEEIQTMAAAAGLDPRRLSMLDRRYARENFCYFDTIFRPDPHVQNILWQRQQVEGDGFVFCGLAHAIGGLETGELLERLVLSPSENSDAIVCPSHAVKAAIKSFWEIYADYLQIRVGARFECPAQLPIIPLGVDLDHYASLTSVDKRKSQRDKLKISDDDVVLLWVGRLSHAIKAHPLVMFQAAERTAQETGANIHLVMQGYFVPEDAEPQFRKLAADFCQKAKVTFVPNKDPRFPDGLWAAGDIFLSLIDNMQESFGLTPIEAMAAGLPRVISDWDGYRDSVAHGEDGYLIRTTQPPAGAGRALSELLLSGKEMYGGFLAKSALSVAVDLDMAVQAITALVKDKDKRKNMADKARRRARATYGWQTIIPAYENLWADLNTKRRAAKAGKPRQSWPVALPQVPDPFTMYAGYPSAPLSDDSFLKVAASMDMIKKLWSHEINIFGLDVMLPPDETTKIISTISSRGRMTTGELSEQYPTLDKAALCRTITWLVKLGILKLN